MEAYRGLAILTTNPKGAIDQAFLRRLRFIVVADIAARSEYTKLERTLTNAEIKGWI